MEVRIVQINLNNCQTAQDLLAQWIIEERIAMCIIQEPWRETRSGWFTSKNGKAAIWWNRKYLMDPCIQIYKGEHTIAVENKHITYISCYCTPNANIRCFEEMLNELTEILRNSCAVVIGGDFNAKSEMWNSEYIDRRGEITEEWAAMHDLRIINSGSISTCVRPQGASIIDLTWVTPAMLNKISGWEVLENTISYSDHRYIRFNIDNCNNNNRQLNNRQIKPIKAWSKKNFDSDRFEAALEWLCADENPPENANEASQRIDSIIKQACDLAMPRIKNREGLAKSVYWWNDNISETRRECIKWYRKWERETRKNNEETANNAQGKYHDSKKELRKLIRRSKRNAWQELILTIDKDPWGMPYKIVMNKLKGRTPPLTETLKGGILNNTLSKLFPRATRGSRRISTDVDPILWDEEGDIMYIEIYRIIKKGKMKNNTAPGPDGVRSLYWKRINDIMMNLLASFLTMCVKESKFPEQWKIAYLVLLPKGQLCVEQPKVRPICLLNEVGKIFEKVLVNRITDWMENSPDSALTSNQFGFCRGRSTIDALTEVKKFIEFTLRNDGIALAVSLDVANAFNSLQWNDIRCALRGKKIPEYICRIIDSYLSDRYIEYPTGHGMERRTMEAGVPQGSVLGPSLWNITYDQVLRVPTEEGCRILGYADDTLILVAAENKETVKMRAELQTATTIRKIKTLCLKVAAEKRK